MPPYIQAINEWAQLILTIGAVIALVKATGRDITAPDRSQTARIEALEEAMKKVDERLAAGDAHFAENDSSNRITQKALLAIIDHELNGNSNDKLREAKDELQAYLIDK